MKGPRMAEKQPDGMRVTPEQMTSDTLMEEDIRRPFEVRDQEIDALNARIAELEAENKALREALDGLVKATERITAGMYAGAGHTNPSVPGEQVAGARNAIGRARAALAREEGKDG
jgi:hypothetical protein